jgi:DNA-binding beta-propeller fold protein YncE
MEYLETKFA